MYVRETDETIKVIHIERVMHSALMSDDCSSHGVHIGTQQRN